MIGLELDNNNIIVSFWLGRGISGTIACKVI